MSSAFLGIDFFKNALHLCCQGKVSLVKQRPIERDKGTVIKKIRIRHTACG